jgi:hypothetical protein
VPSSGSGPLQSNAKLAEQKQLPIEACRNFYRTEGRVSCRPDGLKGPPGARANTFPKPAGPGEGCIRTVAMDWISDVCRRLCGRGCRPGELPHGRKENVQGGTSGCVT